MLNLKLSLVIFSSALLTVYGKIKFGECPEYSAVPSLNLTEYMGVWYEIRRLPNFERGMICVFAEYTLIHDSSAGTYVKVNNTGYEYGTQYHSVIGRATQPNPPSGALAVSFSSGPLPTEPNYYVLDVDTSSYVLIYDCSTKFGIGSEDAWILGRAKTLSQDIVNKLTGILTSMGVDVSDFNETPQDNCP